MATRFTSSLKSNCMKSNQNRIGEISISNQGEKMVIESYKTCHDFWVRFENGYLKHSKKYNRFLDGGIFNPTYPSACGIGIIDYEKEDISKRKAYDYWYHMIERCYSHKHRCYEDVIVCDEWLHFKNFEKWFNDNYYEVDSQRMCLDKDLIDKHSRIYSPSTCVIIPQNINKMLIKQKFHRGEYPIGVFLDKRRNTFYCNLYVDNKLCCKSGFTNPYDAFIFYKTNKERMIKEMADKYKSKIPQKVYDAMYNYQVDITD